MARQANRFETRLDLAVLSEEELQDLAKGSHVTWIGMDRRELVGNLREAGFGMLAEERDREQGVVPSLVNAVEGLRNIVSSLALEIAHLKEVLDSNGLSADFVRSSCRPLHGTSTTTVTDQDARSSEDAAKCSAKPELQTPPLDPEAGALVTTPQDQKTLRHRPLPPTTTTYAAMVASSANTTTAGRASSGGSTAAGPVGSRMLRPLNSNQAQQHRNPYKFSYVHHQREQSRVKNASSHGLIYCKSHSSHCFVCEKYQSWVSRQRSC